LKLEKSDSCFAPHAAANGIDFSFAGCSWGEAKSSIRILALAHWNRRRLLFPQSPATSSIADATKMLWEGLLPWTIANQTLQVLDHLLVVLMLVEILHTVRISYPLAHAYDRTFLVVGLIASIRRILVIILEASTFTKEGTWSPERASIFRGQHSVFFHCKIDRA
jgi:Phosphate-starvation-inducible E family